VDDVDRLYPGCGPYLEDKKMTGTIVILISVIALILSIFVVYFYDKKLTIEIVKHEERMKNK
jgi:hypothetical protein